MKPGQDHLSVAQALYQLEFYLQTLQLSFNVKDIYKEAYEQKRGAAYKDDWLDVLSDNPAVKTSIDEPFTTHTIAETLLRTGHDQLVRVLIKRIQEAQIGFTHAYIVGMERRNR